MLSELVKKAYEDMEVIKEKGISVNPQENKITIGLNILEAKDWCFTTAGAVEGHKQKKAVELLKSLAYHLSECGEGGFPIR